MPLANALLTADQLGAPDETYPLDLVLCPSCTLVQLAETVPPEQLFREYYYCSSFSDTMLRHSQELAETLIETQKLGRNSLVLEIGSNDGYLLKHYRQNGIPVLGVEPATNVARIAREKNDVPTRNDFFSDSLAQQLLGEGYRADVIHGNNVLAHIPDLHGVLRGCALLLKPGGLLVVEVPYVKEMIDRCYFDTIYHEHVFYFSLTALDTLFARHQLHIHDLERFPIHGGTLRVLAGPAADQRRRAQAVVDLLEDERQSGLGTSGYYLSFGAKIASLRDRLLALLRQLKAAGKRIAVYGASAKGSTLLNYFGLGKDVLEYVVDRNVTKQGHFMPGSRLPIYAPEKLVEDLPDFALLLTWNFAEEIVTQQAEYRRRGGRFIVPLPELRII